MFTKKVCAISESTLSQATLQSESGKQKSLLFSNKQSTTNSKSQCNSYIFKHINPKWSHLSRDFILLWLQMTFCSLVNPMWTFGTGKKPQLSYCVKNSFSWRVCSSERAAHGICAQVRRREGEIFHTAKHQSADIWSGIKAASPGLWEKRHSPIYKQELPDQDMLQEEWECVCVGVLCVGVWMDGWGLGELITSEQRAGAHISLRWSLLSWEIYQLRVKVFSFKDALSLSLSLSVRWVTTGLYSRGMIGLRESQPLHGRRCPHSPF